MLGPDDPLPHRPRRVLVAGTSGTGKTTLAARLAPLLGSPHVELDSLFHGPGWTPRPTFAAEVEAFTATDAWVTEWGYSSVLVDLLPRRADLVVWLDLPYRVTLARLVRRTLRRRLRREELWHGNHEPPLRTLLTDPEHVVRWSISTRHRLADAVPAAATAHPHLVVCRLQRPRDVDRWVAALRRSLA